MRDLIEKQWEDYKKDFHSNPVNKGKEIEHINGREGCFKSCLLLLVGLTKKQHEQEHKDYNIFKSKQDLIREISINWDKRRGCRKIQHSKCYSCLLLSKEAIKDDL